MFYWLCKEVTTFMDAQAKMLVFEFIILFILYLGWRN